MKRFNLLTAALIALICTSGFITVRNADAAQCDGSALSTYTEGLMRSISNCDRKAAAERAAASHSLSQESPNGPKAPVGILPRIMSPAPMPDYFGGYPNYANSPLPTGSVTTITVTNGGAGYTAPVVTISDARGAGSGATASATLNAGVISGINITAGGAGYVAPVISIADPTGAGASASATIGGTLTGGIRKFVDTLPGLGAANANNLGQYLPVATADTVTFAGSDYYQIGVVDYTQQMHSDLPATTQLRGYKDLLAAGTDANPHYLGPVIVAQRNKPVRIRFTNMLGANSTFFLPVDSTIMGAGMGPLDASGNPCDPMTQTCATYSPNRALLHLHGGDNPWISDGTPHQWVTPSGETTPFKKGLSFQNVPDMEAGATPTDGIATYYWPNGQSSRLMFYHDHSYGITRLNVYGGEAAGYLLHDANEDALISSGVLPDQGGGVYNWGIPLIIQDKTFVPEGASLAAEDPTWTWGSYGNLWFPHVYMPNQNPADLMGVNAMGRWDYGPWFWPPMDPAGLKGQPVQCPGYPAGTMCPGTPNPSIVPEAFMDTPLVNGAAYPIISVGQKAYRFRILNASNDRTIGVQLYYAADANGNVCNGAVSDSGPTTICTEVKMAPALPHDSTTVPPLCTIATSTDANGLATGLTTTPTGLPLSCWPTTWPTDGRDGGVPDPATAGPAVIQIGTEGGFLPAPVVIPSTPVGYNYNRRDIVVLNVSSHSLMLGPAERADIIIDFSQVPDGSRLIMYNDAPAPIPAFDTRYDYYTGDPDQTATGGAPSTLPGYGPNTRTIMQFQVSSALGTASAYDLAGLQTAFASGASQGAFAATQPTPIVPQAAYGSAYNTTYTDTFSRIQDTALTFTPIDPATGLQSGAPVSVTMIRKTIQELFDPDYGRMNATLGTELPLTNFLTQTTIPLFYVDPPTEIIKDGESQIWKITHNGVDTHSIHFHLFNVQLINRVGWDGAVRPPDSNELGWKETVRMNPLEDVIVALKPIRPNVPWALPDSVRPLDVTMPLGSTGQFTGVDPYTNNPVTVTNELTNFGWEYVWHCHLLGHEENDMMRPIVFQVGGVDVSPTSLSFGLQPANTSSSSQAITLTNTSGAAVMISTIAITGTNAAEFSQSNGCIGSLAGGGTCTINVQFTPTTWGDRSASLTINTSDPARPSVIVPLSGQGTVVSMSAASLTYANQLVGASSAAQTITLYNLGSTALPISSVSVTGTNAADFIPGMTKSCGTSLAAGGSCTISVKFTPTAVGPRSADLTIVDSDPTSPQTVALSGAGIAPVAAVTPTSLSFSSPVNTTTAAQTVTVSNTGTAPLVISSVALGGTSPTQFGQTNTCPIGGAGLAAGGSCTISVRFRATTTGTKTALLNVNVAAPASSKSVSLTGTVLAPALTLAPASLAFSSPLNVTSTAQPVTVSNTGAARLVINSISFTGTGATSYAQTNNCPIGGTGIAPGGSCTVNVTFRPTTTGTKTASLSVNPAAPATSAAVTLTGTIVVPTFSLTPGSLSFGNQTVYTTSTAQTITLTNTGPLALRINGISVGGLNASNFTQTNTCGPFPRNLAAGANCTVSVKFRPTSKGAKTAALKVSAASPATSQSVPLSGTGQ